MDPEVTRFLAHLDQTRAELKSTLAAMPRADLIQLFRDCGSGRLADRDDREHLLVGLLAAMAIHDLHGRREAEDAWGRPGPACPNCGENDLLVWLDGGTVLCDRCGTVHDPNPPDVEG